MGQGAGSGAGRRGPGGSAGCGRRQGRPARGRWTAWSASASPCRGTRRRRARGAGPAARAAASRAGPISSSRRLLIRQRAHWPGFGWPGSLQTGQLAQAGGGVQPAHRGSARVPEAIGARRPQAEQAAVRRWQAGHQGRPVTREMPHGVACAADRARQQRQREAAGAQRPVRGPPLDPAAAPAAGAGLQVRRVGDEAVRAQRPALVVAGDGLAAGSAARALLDARVRDAGPADPHAIQRLVDAHHPVTAGAGGTGDPGHAGGVQRVDQPRDRPQRRQMAVPGQQARVVLQRPGQFLLV